MLTFGSHQAFFDNHQHIIPIVHKHSYLSAFYSPAHMRPPMSLQYALWALAAFQHEKYGMYHDALYRRARQYLEADELKGRGEHFLTLHHAQAWALVATSEACCADFTKAAMSSARTVKLVTIMGLHLLDNPNEDESPIAPTLSPPKTWAELEQRRRVFWAAYCMDSHGSISTGWPTLIDTTQVSRSQHQGMIRLAGLSLISSRSPPIFQRLRRHSLAAKRRTRQRCKMPSSSTGTLALPAP